MQPLEMFNIIWVGGPGQGSQSLCQSLGTLYGLVDLDKKAKVYANPLPILQGIEGDESHPPLGKGTLGACTWMGQVVAHVGMPVGFRCQAEN
jgi:hypothetical protein